MLCFSENKQFIFDWNEKFPLDHWWRKKHSVAFNSSDHREITYIDIFNEFFEEQFMEDCFARSKDRSEKFQEYINKGIWLREPETSQEELIDQFDKLDISAFNFNDSEEENKVEEKSNNTNE